MQIQGKRAYKVDLILGDGIRVEVTEFSVKTISAIAKSFHFEFSFGWLPLSANNSLEHRETPSDETFNHLRNDTGAI